MTDLAVVIPSWDWQRVLSRVRGLIHMERRKRAEYIVVIPKAETHFDLEHDLDEWLETDAPEGLREVIETDEYLSPVEAMAKAGQYLLGQERGIGKSPSDIFVFLHDDVLIEQRGWDQAILDHFATHPRCGLAGFGGGVGFAADDIYKVPYDYRQLARLTFVSNMREAESHGYRVMTPCRVAALDGFALIVSRDFYTRFGPLREPGAPHLNRTTSEGAWDDCLRDGVPYHMYDAWISCRAAELGYEVWMLPVACHHQGGQTSVSRQTEYAQVVSRLGYASAEDLYAKGHEAVYRRFAGLLPIRVPNTEESTK